MIYKIDYFVYYILTHPILLTIPIGTMLLFLILSQIFEKKEKERLANICETIGIILIIVTLLATVIIGVIQ